MRTPITLKIKFKSSNLDQFIERYSVDVSRGGIFIRTKEPLPVGTQLRFEFQLQDASSLIAGDGTVVWIREHDPARQGVAPGMGVRFDKLAADSQKVLDRILSEKQKRGDAQLESRFDAGVRASASASGTLSTSTQRVAGHNDFSGGESRSMTPLPGAIPGLAGPEDEFGNESTRVMQNELVQSLADKTRGQEDAANAFAEPEPTRKASVEELKLAVQGSAIERATEKKELGKVEVVPAAEAKKPEAKPEAKEEEKPAVVEAKKEEPKPVEAKKEEPVEAKKPEAKAEAKPEAKEEKRPELVARDAKTKKNKDEPRAEAKNGEAKKAAADKKSGEHKQVKPADKAATAAPVPPRASEPPRKRSPLPLYAGVAVVALVGGYTFFRNNGTEEQQKPAETAAAATTAAQPEATKVAQNDTPKPTETPAAAEAKGDKPAMPPTAAETPNPAKPDKEPTAVTAEKPAGLSVALASDPAGASVTVDGKPVEGVTPTTLTGLDAKKVYDVKVSLKGFHDWKVKLKPKAGDKIDAALVPNEKIVQVASTPPGADVMLDGKRVGKTPFTIHKLDLTKSHALEIKRAGFVTQSRSISATDSFESKGDKDVLAVAMTLEAQPKAAVAATPAVARPRPVARKPAVKKPAEEKPAEAATEKPAVEKPAAAEKPAATEKPAEAAAEKPASDKPAAAEKPAAEKPASDKPAADKPAAGIKVPSWMKQKQPEGGGDKASAPPASDAPTP